MPRLPRIHLDGAIFLISCRGQDGETIFKDKADTQMYLELVNRYKAQYKFRLYAYTLLPERLHLLVEPGDDATISQVMHDLNSAYTKYFNGRTGRRGHLFESRFKSSLVEKTKYLLEATRFVHRQAPAEGAVSSFDLYVLCDEGKPAAGAVAMEEEIREALDFLKNRGDGRRYVRFSLDGASEEERELDKSFRRSSAVGSPEFVERVQNRIQEHAERKDEPAPQAARPNRMTLFFFGGAVILATSASVYFYASRRAIETKYQELVRQKEAEFVEKTKFENQSPIAPTELDGTVWTVESLALPAGKAAGAEADSLRFAAGRFVSERFEKLGFGPTRVTMTPRPGGGFIWETLQTNAAGDTVSWRGDWQGEAMKGVFSWTEKGRDARDFSFFSARWSYAPASPSPSGQTGGAS